MDNVAIQGFRTEFTKLKSTVQRAIGQLDDEQLHARLAEDHNSIRVIMKHMAGNLVSRFTDFLTTDGEKPWRDRDREFVEDARPWPTRAHVLAEWENGWAVLDRALGGLTDEDLPRVVTIRAEPHTVALALTRQVSHHAYHVGQIVLIAKTLRGAGWTYLTIPRGQSASFNASIRTSHGNGPEPAPGQ